MSNTWNLHGSGRRNHSSWEHLHATTRNWTAAWADIDGFHLNHLPDQPPVATHLWAWTTNTWLRVRIDDSHWWAALLTLGSSTKTTFGALANPLNSPASANCGTGRPTTAQASSTARPTRTPSPSSTPTARLSNSYPCAAPLEPSSAAQTRTPK